MSDRQFWVVVAIILCITVYYNASCDREYYRNKPIACYF
jgi:hypothetical protein